MTDFSRLFTQQGTSADELPGLAAGIMAPAGCRPAGPGREEAARLAEMTPPSSIDGWEAALAIIGGHPQREKLIVIIRQMVMTGLTGPEYAAADVMHIVGDRCSADAPDAGDARDRKPRQAGRGTLTPAPDPAGGPGRA